MSDDTTVRWSYQVTPNPGIKRMADAHRLCPATLGVKGVREVDLLEETAAFR
jgi:hypothetical protein